MDFQEIAIKMVSVTCCRVSPDLKALVTLGIKNNLESRPVCLSVGDGANDVPMIQSAHVGIGISGVEGRQAVQASDYAIGQFRFLAPLLLVHGRWAYIRNTFAVCYSFYKNCCFTPAQYWFAFDSASSGQKFYIELGYQAFNVCFSALPVIAYGIWEQDVNQKLSIKYPALYKVGRRNELYNPTIFVCWLLMGLYQSVVLYYIPRFALSDGADSNGQPTDGLWYIGCTVFGACIVVINFTVAITMRYWFWVQHFCLWADILSWWVLLGMFSNFSTLYNTKKLGGGANVGNVSLAQDMYGNITVWLVTLLAATTALLPTLLWTHLQEQKRDAHWIRVHEAENLSSSIFNCGFCGIPCGQNPICCGDGCVDRAKDADMMEQIPQNLPDK